MVALKGYKQLSNVKRNIKETQKMSTLYQKHTYIFINFTGPEIIILFFILCQLQEGM